MAIWKEITQANPAHSENYAQRWRAIAASGKDIYGEARLADAMVERGSRILDAGCGTGRIGGYLAKCGHEVVGSDVDPVLIGYAAQDYPEAKWIVNDLGNEELSEGDFDLIISAGNVMGFIAPEDRAFCLANLARATRPGGRVVIGYGSGPGRAWSFDSFLEMAAAAGLKKELLLQSWDLEPFGPESTFLVAVFRV
ncbi:class I SAM-dependent DNA methyltransferase [Corynebacterium caspium]|uniref:class I SAM-dependent DNA methyltransferase n=1 Tax=Corynebacterium caspium TaxID=234828 RepID=UPI000372B9FF|nr:class I SAM-dependent methyltransferase [Corynebacterium caspium]WKD59323.1 Magnesium-protoporphyrin O-methyltransferase [Corynebacterium caspium DSM 44850]